MLTLDRAIGDFETAGVLIEGKTISAVRPNITAPNAEIIDAARMTVMSGEGWPLARPYLLPSFEMAAHPSTSSGGRRSQNEGCNCFMPSRLCASYLGAAASPAGEAASAVQAL